MKIKIRPTGILIKNNSILLLNQKVNENRMWSLSRGSLEFDESVQECLIREFKEETGLKIEITELLYICDRIHEDSQVLHITLLVNQIGGQLKLGYEPEKDANQRCEDIL